MKRSEMLKIIQDSFNYHMNPPGPTADTDEEMWNRILKDIENVGMLPPIRTEKQKERYDGAHYYPVRKVYSWEPE